MSLYVFLKVKGLESFLCLGGEDHVFLWQPFLSHCAENFCGGVLECFISLGYREILRMSEGGRESGFSVDIVLSHSTDMFRRGSLQCVTTFSTEKKC